jgi:Acyl-CoA reductase (LuxC).
VISKLPQKIAQNMNLLIGDNKFDENLYLPFDKRVIEFFNDLSKIILLKNKNRNSEIISFGFWCRKNNLLNYSNNFDFNNLRVGRGISFHVTPSNVPLNFCYSMAFGLLSGNSCIIKISNKNFVEVDQMINFFKKILKKKKFHFS